MPAASSPEPTRLEWQVRSLMADRGIRTITQLAKLLDERGVSISIAQLGRLVDGKNKLWNQAVIEGLMDVLDCELGDLIHTSKQGEAMGRQFGQVFALEVGADFEKIEREHREAPWVNYRRIDFPLLARLLGEAFSLNEDLIVVANDVVDFTVADALVKETLAAYDAGRLQLEGLSFGVIFKAFWTPVMQRVSKEARARACATGLPVIDVSGAWQDLQVNERTKAPPPRLIVFGALSRGRDEGYALYNSIRLRLGLSSVLEASLARVSQETAQEKRFGELPSGLSAGLEQVFGFPFVGQTALHRFYSD